QPHRDLSDHQWKMIGGGLIGLVIGFVAGLLGIGGGVLVVPLLIFFLQIPTKQAAATSMFIVCFSSLAGFITHASIAVLDWKLVLPAVVMCLIGGQLGSRIMVAKLKGRMVQILFGIVLLGFVAKLLQKIFL
ncbi:MAG: sulfite exporter TauE/SafE family protein, partial [Desulfobacterales bacterium]|nr:sulfite exporter TauE/SafE family protein [Desulfobacterales bacterium]